MSRILASSMLLTASFACSSAALAANAEPASVSQSTGTPQASMPPATSPEAAPKPPEPAADLGTGSSWEFRLTPYVWTTAMEGTVSIDNRAAKVNLTIDDILKNLDDVNFIGGLHLEASYEKFTIFGDVMYASVGTEATGPAGERLGAGIDQGLFEVGGAYALLDLPLGEGSDMRFRFEPLLGARIYTLDADLTLLSNGDKRSRSFAWVDAIGGGRVALAFSKSFELYGRFDIGGGGSNFAWNGIVGLDWKFCGWGGLDVGWRWLSIDYSDTEGLRRFDYDMVLSGPFIGLQIRF